MLTCPESFQEDPGEEEVGWEGQGEVAAVWGPGELNHRINSQVNLRGKRFFYDTGYVEKDWLNNNSTLS